MHRSRPVIALTLALASCVSPRQAPQPAPPMPTPALPAAPPQQDWRDVPLTPGTWTWQGSPGTESVARFGVTGGATAFTVRCGSTTRTMTLSGTAPDAATMTVTTSFGTVALPTSGGAARLPARDPRLDQIAFSRGRFLVDQPGLPRLVLPAWPEVARVIEDCRG